MPQTNCDVSDWELSKENIQPIKQGRKPEVLSHALNDLEQKKLHREKHEFEEELRTYDGNDPLDIWFRYVLWVEQNYPKGGKHGNLFKLIENCFMALSSKDWEGKYNKDERYLQLWIKYANLCPCSLDVYSALNSKNMFTELSTFYKSWALEMEESGNLKKTNAIYLEGLKKKASPVDALEMAYTKFQSRVALRTLEGLNNPEEENADAISQRKAFSALMSKGTKAKAPTERVSTVVGSAGKLLSTASKANAMGPNFKIFQDENACEKALISDEVAVPSENTFTSHTTTSKENLKNASVWSKNKVKQKTTTVVPVENVESFQKPSFSVHKDECMDEAKTTHSKPSDFAGILTARKNESDWHVPLFVADPFNPNAVPQYSKQLVYVGNEEFSFEELRALACKRKEDKEKEDAVQEELKKLRLMLKQKDEILKQKEYEISTLIHKKSSDTQENAPKARVCSNNSKRLYEDSWVAINKTSSFMANATQDISQDCNESSTKALLSLKPLISKNGELNEIPLAKEDQLSSFSVGNSTREISRSPTVNTKFANKIVGELFKGTLLGYSVCDTESKTSLDKVQHKVANFEIHVDSKICSNDAAVRVGSAALQNSQENKAQFLPALPIDSDENPKLCPFPIYSDEIGEPAPIPVYNDEIKSPPLNSFPIYCDENEGQDLQVKCNDKNGPGTSAPFKIYDENGENNAPFKIFVDENSVSDRAQVSKKKVLVASPSKLIYEDQENLPPPGYQITKEKRTFAGILKPAKDIPFIPLEEQEKDNEEEEDLDGIAPLSQSRMPDDFTMKMPRDEDFFKFNGVASTPMPLSFGIVPQVNVNGDDYTMALPIKSQFGDATNIEPQTAGSSEAPGSSLGNSKDSAGSSPSNKSKEENSAELMPPPINEQVLSPAPQPPQDGVFDANLVKNLLSPIMEASREYKSSTSSSSGNYTTLGTHSNLHGITQMSHYPAGSASRSINISQSKCLYSYGDVDCALASQEATRSGYFADKSKGESLNEVPSCKPAKIQKMQKVNNFDESFDPDKIAKMLNISFESEACKVDCGSSVTEPKAIEDEDMKLNVEKAWSPLKGSMKYPKEIDPFCKVLQERILKNLKNYIEERAGCVVLHGKMPQIKVKSQISLGKEVYKVKRLKGSGAYAQVFHASTVDPMNVTIATTYDDNDDDESDEQQMILKVQRPACKWEFYICHELRERLKTLNTPQEIVNSLMRINRAYFFPQGSILVTQYHKFGTLLDGVNKFKKLKKNLSEDLIFYIMSKLIEAVIALHSCHIIHGDLKPDNVLLVQTCTDGDSQCSTFGSEGHGIKLIDFGRSIDMDLYPSNTSFSRKVSTDGFTICEMRDSRPWTYQTDYYGLAAIAHTMIWGSYMNVKKEDRIWKLSGVNFYRYISKGFWESFFYSMLNIPSCNELPDLKKQLREFQSLCNREKLLKINDMKTLYSPCD